MKSSSRLAGNILGATLIGVILFGSSPAGIALAQPLLDISAHQYSDEPLPGDDIGDSVQSSSDDSEGSEGEQPVVENNTSETDNSTEPQDASNEICDPIVEVQQPQPALEQPQEQAPIVEPESTPDVELDASSDVTIIPETVDPFAATEQALVEEEITNVVDSLAAEEIVLTDMNNQPISLTTEVAAEALGSDPWFEEDGVKHGFVKPGESCPSFIDVCHSSEENAFQAAIDAAPEGKSTTIYVAAQHYETDVVISKPQLTLLVGSIHSLFGEDVWASGEGSAVVNRMTLLYELSGFAGMSVRDEVIVANDGVRIQQAVDLIESGGTVTVASGTYQGFKIKKSGVKVKGISSNSPASGAGNNAPVIQSGLADGNVGIEIDTDNVSIEGFIFSGNDQAIVIHNADQVNINRNSFNNNHWGVYVGGIESQEIQIHHNRFSQNNAAVENATLSNDTSINAQQNWWGSNLGPSRLDVIGSDHCVGDQCGDWVIGSLDYSNWLKFTSSSTPDTTTVPLTNEILPQTSFAQMIIPVTGGQPVALSCTSLCTVLSLPGGEQIELCDLCGQQAVFQTIDESQLPAALPGGMKFVSAVNLDVQSIESTTEKATQDIQVSLLMNVPASRQNSEFAVLVWDAASNDGIGGWRELPTSPVILEQGGNGSDFQQAQIDAQGMGLFVLVGK